MKFQFKEKNGPGCLMMLKEESSFEQNYYRQKGGLNFYTITWNIGGKQKVNIDEIDYDIAPNAVLPIMMNQAFRFEKPEDIIAWQFNSEFYCIANHDAEVGCVGFLFYGPSPTMFVGLGHEELSKMERIKSLFEEEFISDEDIKAEMLRMLLVQLIIKLTRLAKKQYFHLDGDNEKFNLMRQYNLQVEIHYHKERQVQFYAGLLNKSPKTISNIFSLYSKKTPLQVIHDRIIAEAKRLFYRANASKLGYSDC